MKPLLACLFVTLLSPIGHTEDQLDQTPNPPPSPPTHSQPTPSRIGGGSCGRAIRGDITRSSLDWARIVSVQKHLQSTYYSLYLNSYGSIRAKNSQEDIASIGLTGVISAYDNLTLEQQESIQPEKPLSRQLFVYFKKSSQGAWIDRVRSESVLSRGDKKRLEVIKQLKEQYMNDHHAEPTRSEMESAISKYLQAQFTKDPNVKSDKDKITKQYRLYMRVLGLANDQPFVNIDDPEAPQIASENHFLDDIEQKDMKEEALKRYQDLINFTIKRFQTPGNGETLGQSHARRYRAIIAHTLLLGATYEQVANVFKVTESAIAAQIRDMLETKTKIYSFLEAERIKLLREYLISEKYGGVGPSEEFIYNSLTLREQRYIDYSRPRWR